MSKNVTEAPRIYNIFPLLAGSSVDWERHLPRIAAMGFNWVFVNPFHYPGFSGSLYAVKDYYRLHPLFQGRSHEDPATLLLRFLDAAHGQGLRVMMDLVINHTSKDSLLAAEHPEWFAHEADGRLRSPYAVDPDEPDDIEKRTVWGDLADIDFETTPDLPGLVGYWQELVRFYTDLGFDGFRGDAAYKIPGEVWAPIIATARNHDPEAMFFAETLGCQPEEVLQFKAAGFDYLFNSSKWWDFRADWLLGQYEQFRVIAPSIAFPESHDTKRMAGESDGDERVSRLRYVFAAAFSSGLMLPMGYEFGFRRKPDVVTTRPEDWETPNFDISAFITQVNAMKAATPVLNEEGPQQRLTPADDTVVALLREGERFPGRVLTLINPDAYAGQRFGAADAAQYLGCSPEAMRELLPGPASPEWIELPPLSIRLFAAGRRGP
jgi:starch synthase (maltosyl-transferring)